MTQFKVLNQHRKFKLPSHQPQLYFALLYLSSPPSSKNW